jgi:hypothetical protein
MAEFCDNWGRTGIDRAQSDEGRASWSLLAT